MGIFDKLLGNKNITEQISKLAGNANIAAILAQLTANKDFMSKLSSAKDDNDIHQLIASATDAFKDMKLTDEEKKDLVNQLKNVASGLIGKK
jgi:predicted DNA-binding protein with PD1-like motif